MAVFNTVLNEKSGDSTDASNMVSNVSIAYNAADASQRNALYQAQQRISKSQVRQESKEKAKALAKAKAGIKEETYDDFGSSIFLEGKFTDNLKKKLKFLNKPKKKEKKTDTNEKAKQLAMKQAAKQKADKEANDKKE